MTIAFLEGPDLIVVLIIVLVLFGGAKLPGLARSLGEAQREFRKATNEPEKPEGLRAWGILQGSELKLSSVP